jgi:ketosteroid isomerase-like protein
MSPRTRLTAGRIAAVLILALVVAGCASARTGASRAANLEERARAEIERRVLEVLEACEAKDFARLESYHLYGPKFSRFSDSSPARLGAEATRQAERDGLAAISALRMEAEGLKVDVFGDTGVATFILRYGFDSGGQSVRRSDRTTLVLVRDGGEWRIAHEHLSPINEGQPHL